jgi:hypothetical protein
MTSPPLTAQGRELRSEDHAGTAGKTADFCA